MKIHGRHILFLLLFFCGTAQTLFSAPPRLVQSKILYLREVTYRLTLQFDRLPDSVSTLNVTDGQRVLQRLPLHRDGETLQFKTGPFLFKNTGKFSLHYEHQQVSASLPVLPGWLSLLPPLIAILLALLSRQVLISLFAGVWLGAVFIYDYNPLTGFLNSLTEYVGKAPATPDHAAILIFSLTLGGMVGVISRSGGTRGIVERLRVFASNARKGQFVTWLMGVLVFFDDYANTLIVGNTMRPLTDKLKISREKLSYLVDSTAAPVANIAIISTWIGYELSLISQSFKTIGLTDNPYIIFLKTIPFNFYPLYTLAFGFFVAILGRDFFSMFRAEKRAAEQGQVLAENATPLMDVNSSELQVKEGVPLRWYNAALPVGMVILTTLAGLWFTGLQNVHLSPEDIQGMSLLRYVSLVVGQADSFAVLMWAAFIGSFTAILMALAQRILNLNEAIMSWVGGVKSMVMAALILTLAWAIGNVCMDLQTADYVIGISRQFLSPHWLPFLSFLIAGLIAFSTGTSWGTMAILAPIVIPLSYELPLASPAISPVLAHEIFLSSIASILAGATFGDHCSPISDTTIMSSMASGADHIDHVRTQLPYALIAAAVAILFGYIPVGFGLHDWIVLLSGFLFIFLVIRFLGKRVQA